jgi:FkbM family methyltransferase
MKYFSREEVERIGSAGSYRQVTDDGLMFRYLSSFWLYVEEYDNAFTPHGFSGFWEAWVTKWISQELDNHDTFIDVGANVGYYTMLAAQHGLKTYAVEPQRNLCEMIKLSLEANRLKNVNVVNLALSDHRGMMNLVVPTGHSGGASFVEQDSLYPENNVNYTVSSVDVSTLNYAFPTVNQKILVKIDAEGAEPLIIDGAEEFLAANQVTAVLEWSSPRWKRPVKFAEKLREISSSPLAVIDYHGNERPVTPAELAVSETLEMVVIRS